MTITLDFYTKKLSVYNYVNSLKRDKRVAFYKLDICILYSLKMYNRLSKRIITLYEIIYFCRLCFLHEKFTS